VKTIPATRVVAPPPTRADAALVEAYRSRGLRIDESAPEVSLLRARSNMQEAIKGGNYQVALEWCETVLQRYRSHPEFLRAKASLLLMMGEREKAIEVYEQAESVESDPAVRKKLEELQRQQP
jgi:tetratricopeptide (TPR) repeat protein